MIVQAKLFLIGLIFFVLTLGTVWVLDYSSNRVKNGVVVFLAYSIVVEVVIMLVSAIWWVLIQ